MSNFNQYFASGGLHGEEAECIYNLIEEYNIKKILEIGCGNSSTSLFTDIVHAGNRFGSGYSLNSYENDEKWASIVNNRFKELKDFNEIKIYTPGKLEINDFYDLIFIDGPVGAINRESSFISAINKSKYVIAHDAYNEHISKFINEYYLKNNSYKKIKFPHPNPSSGIIFVEKNEK